MRMRRRSFTAGVLAVPLAIGPKTVFAQAAPADTKPSALFAVEFRIGRNWDKAKPAHEQEHFREHSTNLKRLRDGGRIVIGARYSDKGFLVLAAQSESDVRALIDADPAVQSNVFDYEVSAFAVFYGGCVEVSKRRS